MKFYRNGNFSPINLLNLHNYHQKTQFQKKIINLSNKIHIYVQNNKIHFQYIQY